MTTKRGREQSRRALDARFRDLTPLRVQFAMPHVGWVRAIRESLGMSAEGLGARLGVTKRSVQQLEEGEVSGSAQLATLRRAAEALNCDLVHVLVPRRPLEQLLETEAQAVAHQITLAVRQTMALEAQSVDAIDLTAVVAELQQNPSRIWNRPVSAPASESAPLL